jgi:hypothetical protein
VLFTILRTTRLTFRDAWGLEYGFALHPPGWPGYAPNTATLPSRFQQRTIAALIEAISIAGWEATGVQRTSAPEVEVAPPSLVPAQAPPLFVFRAKFPGTTDALALQSALTQRTEVGWWRATAAGWEYEILWPPQPGTPWASFTVIPPSPGADEIELVLTLAPGSADPFAGRTFKLDVHAWTTDGAWDRATSYQQW